jgi:hypothetical protein
MLLSAGLSWEDAKQQIQALLQQSGVPIRALCCSCSLPSRFFSLGWIDTKRASMPLHQLGRCHASRVSRVTSAASYFTTHRP